MARIAVVTETFYPFMGGSSRRYHQVFRRIAAKGYDVTLYTVRLKESWKREEEIDGIYVKRTPFVLKEYITRDGFRSISSVIRFSLWALKMLIRDGRFDLIEANHCPIFPSYSSWLASRAGSIPLSVTFHESWYNNWYRYVPHRIYAPIGIILERTTTWLPDLAIAVSGTTADSLVRNFGMDRRRIRVIPNGVELELFNGYQFEKERKILYAGRLNPHKKLELLLSAYKQLKERDESLRLEIIGDGPYRHVYEQYAKRLGLKDITFRGNVSDRELADSYKRALIYVLPSIREGQSITLLEAMAAGTPQVAVSSDGSAAREVLGHSNSGLLAMPSADSIADRVSLLLHDIELWNKLRENGLSYVRNYDWDKIVSMHLEAYTMLMNR